LPRAFPHWSASPRGTAGSRQARESPAAGSTSGTGCPCPRKTLIQTKDVSLTKHKNKNLRRQMTNKLKSVLWIRDILVRIRLTNESGSGSYYFLHWPSRVFLSITFWRYINYIYISQKEVTKQ
jgi:hypothetical protein